MDELRNTDIQIKTQHTQGCTSMWSTIHESDYNNVTANAYLSFMSCEVVQTWGGFLQCRGRSSFYGATGHNGILPQERTPHSEPDNTASECLTSSSYSYVHSQIHHFII